MIRLMLVDDHAVVREGYRRLLERRAELRIEAEADDGADALQLLQRTAIDVVVLDLSLPRMGGIELATRIRQRFPGVRMLAFSMHRDPLFASQALRAGALGYVTKSSPPDVLVDAVFRVARGEKVLSPDIAPDIALTLLQPDEHPAQALSPREFEILRLLLDGRPADEIGRILHLSPKTVQNAHYQIKGKLGVRSDIELARLALKFGLL